MKHNAFRHATRRHNRIARAARGLLSRWLAGNAGCPIVFRAPDPADPPIEGASENLYVHLPFCGQICPHCPYNRVLWEPRLAAGYGTALTRELAAYLSRPGVPAIETLYFGGGTPSRTPELIERVMELAGSRLAKDAEVGAEVHPADATPELLARLRRAGINRVSLGVESLRPDLLRLLARPYSPDQALSAIGAARSAGFSCVDVNLVHGIPGQTVRDAVGDARACLARGADQISAYPLFGFDHTPLGRRKDLRTPGWPARWRAQNEISRACRSAGLIRSSVWSFTRPGVPPYSTVTHEDYIGFGAGAASKVSGVFWFNTFSVPAYANCAPPRPALVMRADARLRRLHWLYWAIYRMRVDASRYRQLFGADLGADFRPMWAIFDMLGLSRPERDGWSLTERGAVWVHRLQTLYSLSYVDLLWRRCQQQAWPREVVLR